MKPCTAPHCNGSQTKNSLFCLTHAIEIDGPLALARALKGNLPPDMYYPAVMPLERVWGGIVKRIKQESES